MSYNFGRKHALCTASFQCLAKSLFPLGNHPLPPSSCGAHVSKWCLTGQNGAKMYTVIYQTSQHYHTSAQTPSVSSS